MQKMIVVAWDLLFNSPCSTVNQITAIQKVDIETGTKIFSQIFSVHFQLYSLSLRSSDLLKPCFYFVYWCFLIKLALTEAIKKRPWHVFFINFCVFC